MGMDHPLWVLTAFGDTPEEGRRLTDTLRPRILSYRYEASVEQPPKLTIVFQNRDKFLTHETNYGPEGTRIGGFKAIRPGTIYSLQYGYAHEIHGGFEPGRHSQLRFFKVTTVGPDTLDSITVSCVGPGSTRLGTKTKASVFTGRLVSDVVRDLCKSAGYDDDHLWIQPSKYKVKNLILQGSETYLEFFYRVAAPLNYVVYETTDRNGLPIFHFHKFGWTPKSAIINQDRTRVATIENGAVDEKGFGDKANGNLASPTGLIVNNYPGRSRGPPEKYASLPRAELLEYTGDYDLQSVPAEIEVAGIDVETGAQFTQSVRERQLDSEPLSRKTDFLLPATVASKGGGQTPFGQRDDVFAARIAFGLDSGGQVVQKVVVGSGDKPKDQAVDEAKAALEAIQEQATKIDVTVVGEPLLDAGQIWYADGFGVFDALYQVRSMQQQWDVASGYKTSAQMTSDGLDAGSSESRERDDRYGLRIHFEDGGATTRVAYSTKKEGEE